MGTNWLPDLQNVSRAKYIVLLQSIREAVRDGGLSAGMRLPPVRELAWELKVTPGTVARSYRLGVEEGLLETTVGRGTFVAGSVQAPLPDTPLYIPATPDLLDFRGCRVPDMGQGEVIGSILQDLGKRHRYTEYPTSSTDLAAREAVVGWLAGAEAGRMGAEHVVLANGAQNACLTALQAILSGPAPVILTEDLGYPGVRHAARLLRAKVVGVGMDRHGLRPDLLAAAYREHGGQVLVTSANVHSPTTRQTPPERKAEIAELARRFQLHVIEDDCHRISARPGAPSYRELLPERGWFVSSLTKMVSSSLRFGFAVCPPDFADLTRQAAQSSFYGLAQPVLDLGEELLRSGAAEEIRARVEAGCASRVKSALNILGGWDLEWREDVPFLWLNLPRGWRISSFVLACERKGLRFKSADEFTLAGSAAPSAVRIALNTASPTEARETALRQISDMLANPPASEVALQE